MIHKILAIYHKDLKELVRDKKTLWLSIIVPVLFIPGIIIGQIIANSPNKDVSTVSYQVLGDKDFASLIKKPNWKQKVVPDWKEALRNEEIDIVFQVPDDFLQSMNGFESPKIQLFYNNLGMTSPALRKAKKVLLDIQNESRGILAQKLGLSEKQAQAIKTPFLFESKGVATDDQKLGLIAGVLVALFVVITSSSGMTYPVLDIGAGEKERGTLETLLTSPINTFTLSISKSAIISTAGLVSITLVLLTFLVLKSFAGLFTITLLHGVLCFLAAIPFVLVISPLFLILSVYAKTYKEAQGYISTMMLFTMAPVGLIFDSERTIQNFLWIPGVNSVMAIKEIMQNNFSLTYLAPIIITSIVAWLIGVYICSLVYKKNSLI